MTKHFSELITTLKSFVTACLSHACGAGPSLEPTGPTGLKPTLLWRERASPRVALTALSEADSGLAPGTGAKCPASPMFVGSGVWGLLPKKGKETGVMIQGRDTWFQMNLLERKAEGGAARPAIAPTWFSPDKSRKD